jgi:hypothetical protein
MQPRIKEKKRGKSSLVKKQEKDDEVLVVLPLEASQV